MSLEKRKISFDLGKDIDAAVADNTAPITGVLAPKKKTNPPRQPKPKPAVSGGAKNLPVAPKKHEKTTASANPPPNVLRLAIRVPVKNQEIMSRAKQVAEETGAKVDTALSLFVRNAIERLKEIDEKDDYEQLARGHDLLETFGFYRTTIMFPEKIIKRVSESIDPYGIFSDAKLISLAISQLLDETMLQELDPKRR